MPETSSALNLLGAMITPAVLISACGMLIFSTSARLARIVDRIRALSRLIEELFSRRAAVDFPEERRAEMERQLSIHARRSRLIQGSLTSLYISVGIFVATMISIGLVALAGRAVWLPSALGIAGTIILFYGCVLLIAETRLALHSVRSEMEFTFKLRTMYQARPASAENSPVESGEKPPHRS
jgi:threonine/homoserine/homoserine lactone efflux protein